MSLSRSMPLRGRGVDAMLSFAKVSIRAEMQRRYEAVTLAVEAADGARLERAIFDDDAATRARARSLLGSSPEARAVLLPELRRDLDREADAMIARAAFGSRRAFAAAITRVYSSVAVLVVLGWLVTWLLPELPLRKTNR